MRPDSLSPPDRMQPTPPQPPSAPNVIEVPVPSGRVTVSLPGNASPSAFYEAQVAARREIQRQLERVQETRNEVASWLKNDEITTADRSGLETRLKETDARISDLEKQLAQADAAVTKAASVPGAIVEKPEPVRPPQYDETAAIIGSCLTIFVFAPIAIAYARRIWKRGATVIAPVPKEVTDRLDAMGQAVESIALEVERIGEGQRFITKVMGDRQLGAGAAQPISVGQGERVEANR
ncbi:MAG: hypothetical protein K2R93_14615 [Gemmatimonadaceae bacterium]|nr:hypothetical protein [Gemmatimonadaceae bacterium]